MYLGSVNVICEGYDYPDDPYILAGSCGLEYTLELTQAGRERNNAGHKSYYEESYSSNLFIIKNVSSSTSHTKKNPSFREFNSVGAETSF